MTRVMVCTDSSALLPREVADRKDVIVVPISIALDGVAYEDELDAIDDFYARLAAGAQATTSQPSPGRLLDAYRAAAATGADEVLSIHLDERASGTLRSAQLAARDAPIPVTVVDTTTVSYGVGVCVRAAAEALSAGASAGEAAARARAIGASLENVFVARAGAGGRVPASGGWTLLSFVDGSTVAGTACAGPERAVEAMTGRVADGGGLYRAAVGHAAASSEVAADALAGALQALPNVEAVERYRVGPAVGAHTGGDSFGAFWWPGTTL